MSGKTLAVFPLRNTVLLPGAELTVMVTHPELIAMLGRARTSGERLLVIPSAGAELGVEAEVLDLIEMEPKRYAVVLRGLSRCRLIEYRTKTPFLTGNVESVADIDESGPDVDALVRRIRAAAEELEELSETPLQTALEAAGPGRVADLAAAQLGLSVAGQVAVLLATDQKERLSKVADALEARLRSEAQGAEQREQILRERKQQILSELGEDDESPERNQLDEKIRLAGMPSEVAKVAFKQARRLESTSDGSPEQGITRNYLEWLTELPWAKASIDRLDLAEARAVLDADHHGLEKVKRRVLEYLAVRKLKPGKKGPILCLAGPPGVGKTSLGRSVARALGREFVRVSLGGVRDEAEIRGHRRTYVGALPGRILQGLRKAGTRNPVFMLDEIDKLSGDFRGDPAAALLEVLDPEQNDSFSDHYLEVPFDLSQVIFIATANELSTIAPPLRDRMEVISLPGYPLAEKRRIAEDHLVPRQLAEHGLTAGQVRFAPAAIEAIVTDYTREAGVRNLERELANVIRGLAVRVVTGELFSTEVRPEDLAAQLGPARFSSDVAAEASEPGVSTGLAWTPSGGEILFVEATRMPGRGNLVLTGQLGDVMKESATAAMSYVRSNAARWGLSPELFARSDFHLHVPDGGTPKDGPSAGNALVSALVSLLTGRRVRADVAMTGEITLRGAVLPVGGIASKLLAAHRAGVKRVILPDRNAKDLVELPPDVRASLDIVLVKRIDEMLAAALEPAPAPALQLAA